MDTIHVWRRPNSTTPIFTETSVPNTDRFSDFFHRELRGQVAVVWLLNILPYHNCVATLPCETLVVKTHKNLSNAYAKTIFWDNFSLIFILKVNNV